VTAGARLWGLLRELYLGLRRKENPESKQQAGRGGFSGGEEIWKPERKEKTDRKKKGYPQIYEDHRQIVGHLGAVLEEAKGKNQKTLISIKDRAKDRAVSVSTHGSTSTKWIRNKEECSSFIFLRIGLRERKGVANEKPNSEGGGKKEAHGQDVQSRKGHRHPLLERGLTAGITGFVGRRKGLILWGTRENPAQEFIDEWHYTRKIMGQSQGFSGVIEEKSNSNSPWETKKAPVVPTRMVINRRPSFSLFTNFLGGKTRVGGTMGEVNRQVL